MRIVRIADEEMEHYLMFPELYCKRCSMPVSNDGLTPRYCDECLDVVLEEDAISRDMRAMCDD